MDKWISLILLILPLSVSAQVAWVGPDCKVSWDANPPGELVQGYIIHIRNTLNTPSLIVDANVGNALETTCGVHGLPQGTYEAWVTAYNPAGESGPSTVVHFVLAISAPGSPGGVSPPSGLQIESAGGGT